jgi:hypothetical protein
MQERFAGLCFALFVFPVIYLLRGGAPAVQEPHAAPLNYRPDGKD